MKKLRARRSGILILSSLSFLLTIQIAFVGATIAQQTPSVKTEQANKAANEPAVAEIVAKHLKATGENPKTAKTLETITETEINGAVTKSYRLDDLATARFYQLQEGPNGKTEIAFDGKKMWRKAPFARGYLTDSDPFFKASTMKRPPMNEKKFKLLPNEKIEGKDYIVLQTTDLDPQGQEVEMRYYLDPATYLIKQHAMGSEIKQTVIYDDYRNINGNMIAFSKTLVTPRVTLKTKTVSVKYDVPFDEKKLLFEEEKKQTGSKNGSAAENLPSHFVKTNFDKDSAEGAILPEDLRVESFELVWKTINESYWDKNFGGVDWDAAREKYLPLVKATERSEPFHRLLDKMLGELGRSHLKIYPPSKTISLNTKKEDLRNGVLGLDVRWLDSELVITEVKENSPANNAGIRAGYAVTKINGRTVSDIFEEYRQKNTGFQLGEAIRHVQAFSPHLFGKPGEKITLEMLEEKNRIVTKELIFAEAKLGKDLEFEHKRINQTIGYIKINIFFGDVLTKFQTALNELRDTEGLIIDLRGNPGGFGNLAPAIINLLGEKGGSLGTFTYRYQKNEMTFKGSGAQAYRHPVVVLIDELSGSTAEIFAAGLQDLKRAVIVGTPSAGAVLPSLFQPLPTGGGMQYVIANFETSKGVVLEGKGVTPDRVVRIKRGELIAGRDAVFEAAVEQIKSKS